MIQQSFSSYADPQLPIENRSESFDRGQLMQLIGIGTGVIVALAFVTTLVLWAAGALPTLLALGAIVLSSAALVTCGITLYLVRQRRALLAARVFVYSLAVINVLALLLFGGIQGPAVVSCLVPVVAAGLLARPSDTLRATLVVLTGYALVAIGQQAGWLPQLSQPVNALTLFYMILFAGSTVALALITWQSSRTLANALNQVQEQSEALLDSNEKLVEKNIQQVELGSELSDSSAQLQLASQQQASGASEQASAISEVSTTTEELGSTARQIAQSSEQVAEAAQQTLENLSTGQDAVDESIQAMERIRSRMQDVSERVLGLGERSQQIGEIIDLIDDISDETHLLALNAAIEAAGAGEHGRRFAVVAAEVKNLANRALVAAREVRGVIAEMRQATNSAVLAAEEGGKEVERGVELAHRAGQVMDTIVMMAERTAQSAAEISLATAQQQSASEQVVETMREVADVARQSAAGARQMADSSSTLSAIAERLHGITRVS